MCASPLTKCHSFKWCQVEDLPALEHKVLLNFRRAKGHCCQCGKIRFEAVEFLSNSNPKMGSRRAFLMYKFCEVAPVSRMAEILKRNQMSLWRNDLLMLETQYKHYKIPILRRISVDEVYAKGHHEENENQLDHVFGIITDLKTH